MSAGAPAGLSLTGIRIGCPPARAINGLAPRAAMGLGAGYVAPSDPRRLACTLQTHDPDRLAALVEDPDEPFGRRHAAGSMLAILGDPRLRPLDPALCRVPAGRYRIGLEATALAGVLREFAPHGVLPHWIEKEMPAHLVDLPGFAIGRYPVTQIEYAHFLAETGHLPLPESWPLGAMPPGQGNHPVHGIAPESADAYAGWLAAATGRRFRLPGEAEWEIAAGAGRRIYPWGDRYEPDCANTVETGILATTPVGIFPRGASPFGCLDMAGNAEEYVADAYRPYPGGAIARDDLLDRRSDYRVARGGSFARYRDLARCTRRHGWYESPLYIMGFRIAEAL